MHAFLFACIEINLVLKRHPAGGDRHDNERRAAGSNKLTLFGQSFYRPLLQLLLQILWHLYDPRRGISTPCFTYVFTQPFLKAVFLGQIFWS